MPKSYSWSQINMKSVIEWKLKHSIPDFLYNSLLANTQLSILLLGEKQTSHSTTQLSLKLNLSLYFLHFKNFKYLMFSFLPSFLPSLLSSFSFFFPSFFLLFFLFFCYNPAIFQGYLWLFTLGSLYVSPP